mmetsp:Transcript_2822/g.3289  ORF Transcript_2822/g.3289 Transcript_2822/m.3289 type:complete len:92 (+) Transcript_2822:505-780(+)
MKLPSLGPPQLQCLAPLSSIVNHRRDSSGHTKTRFFVSATNRDKSATSKSSFLPGTGAKAILTFPCQTSKRSNIVRNIRRPFSSEILYDSL